MEFSDRTSWHRAQNRLSRLLERRRSAGKPVYDLTCSNPTTCGFTYPRNQILRALSRPDTLVYRPEAAGIAPARSAIARWYKCKNIGIDPSHLFLTASTSEGYSMVLRLLCNPGDTILVPRPSYPLFDYLAQVNDVALSYYRLRYHDEWQLDINSVRESITPNTKAIVCVHPSNPAGCYLKRTEYRQLCSIAKEYGCALIVDEVFLEYSFGKDDRRMGSTAGPADVLTFTLDGISKMAGLPQMKLGWIAVSGPRKPVNEAAGRLEILCDTYLSVNTPVQNALPRIIRSAGSTASDILSRVKANYSDLRSYRTAGSPCSVLNCEGGWYGILRVPATMTDGRWAEEILRSTGVYLFPGYFFDFEREGYLVVSLLVQRAIFRRALGKIIRFITEHS